MNPKVSLVMPCARPDYPYFSLPDYIFAPTFDSLAQQTFKDFEFIIADCCYKYRGNIQDKCNTHGIDFKHIPVHSPFLDRGMVTIATSYNAALKVATGEFILTANDGAWFPPDWIEKVWNNYKQDGLWTLTIVKPGDGHEVPVDRVIDTRHGIMLQQGQDKVIAAPPEWFYGFSSAPREAILDVNGYDEAFDGQKSLEDCDLGARLARTSPSHFVIQSDIWCIVEFAPMGGYDKRVIYDSVPKCNYAILLYNKATRSRVNIPYTAEDIHKLEHDICGICSNQDRCKSETLRAKFKLDGEKYEYWKNVVTRSGYAQGMA